MIESEIDFLVVAANRKEFDPLIEEFKARELRKAPGELSRYWRAEVRKRGSTPYSVILAKVGRGSTLTASALESAIKKWSPNHVIMGGIAATIPGRAALRGLLISRTLLDASEWKRLPRGDKLRDRPWPCERELVEAAEDLVSNTKRKHVAFGTIISQSDLVRSAKVRDWLVAHASGDDPLHERIVGLEMEGGGVVAATSSQVRALRPGILMVKGAVDYANYHKGDQYQKLAARRSAKFIREFVAFGAVTPGWATAVLSLRGLEGIVRLRPKNEFQPEFWLELMEEAKHDLDLVGHALSKWCMQPYNTHLVRALLRVAKRKGNVRMIVMHPDGENAHRRCEALGLKKDGYRGRILQTPRLIRREVIKKLDRKQTSHLNIHWIDNLDLRYMLIRTDRHMVVSPYFAATQSSNNPLLVLQPDQWHSTAFFYDFNALFDQWSKPVDWKEFDSGGQYHDIRQY